MTDGPNFALSNSPSTKLLSPAESMQQSGALVDIINKNRLIRAQQLAGEAAQNAIGPDGTVDPLKYNQNLLAAGPDAARAAQEAIGQSQALSTAQTGQQGAQLQQSLARFGQMSNALGSLMSDNGGQGPTFARVQQQLQSGMQAGWLKQQDAQAALTGMPTGDDPQSMATRNHMLQTMNEQLQTAQQRLVNVAGTPGQVNTGPTVQPIVTGGALSNRYGQAQQTGAGINVFPSRAQLAQQVEGVNPDGSPKADTLQRRLQDQGQGSLMAPQGGGGGVPDALLPPGYNGAYRGAAGNAVQTGLAPGQSAAAITTANANAQQGAQLQTAAGQSADRKATLTNMLADLSNFQSGPGADNEKQWQSMLQRYAPKIASGFNLSPDRVSSQESFDKLAKQIAMQQAGALGVGSDEKLNTAMGANPNSGLSQQGNRQITAMLLGNEDALTAKASAWQQWQQANGSASYGQFQDQFNKSFDPTVFQVNRMEPGDAQKYVASLPGDKNNPNTPKGAFRQHYNAAVNSGWIPKPGQRGAAPNG